MRQELLNATENDLICAIAQIKKRKAIAAFKALRSAYQNFDAACNTDNTPEQEAFRKKPSFVRMIKNIFSV